MSRFCYFTSHKKRGRIIMPGEGARDALSLFMFSLSARE